jgi:hypothetical protein
LTMTTKTTMTQAHHSHDDDHAMVLGFSREGVEVKTGAAVAAAATVAMVAVCNRNGGYRQQSTKCGSGSGSG